MALNKVELTLVKDAVELIKRELVAQKDATVPETVSIYKFGTFKIKKAPARKARNPKTGESIDMPERTVVRFHPSKTWLSEL